MKFTLSIISPLLMFLSLLPINDAIAAQSEPPLSGLSVITNSDIQNSAIDFVNATSSPGLDGATLKVNSNQRNSDQWRSSL